MFNSRKRLDKYCFWTSTIFSNTQLIITSWNKLKLYILCLDFTSDRFKAFKYWKNISYSYHRVTELDLISLISTVIFFFFF